MPDTACQALQLANAGCLMKPTKITVKTIVGEKFSSITKYELPEVKETIKALPEDYSPDDVWSSDFHSNSPEDLGIVKDWDVDDEIPF
jgi:hypothetical protein